MSASRSRNAVATAVAVDGYKLVSIARTRAPDGNGGDDWHSYRIEQGSNVITGYRRGTPSSVADAVKDIVEQLNQRRMIRAQPAAPTERTPAAAPAATAPAAQHKDLV